ncbi:hypothetical protein H7Y40_00745 [Pedobacter sp.]|nr:hypothetical protein [Candidatus Saccharibacteria bacterium]
MTRTPNNSGFLFAELLIAVAVIGLVGFIGYTAYSRTHDNTAANSSQSPVAQDVTTAPEIKSTTDLVTAEKALDETILDSPSDDAQLDSELNAF